MWWDERKPGGAIRSLIFMAHPGPSLLVTVVLVAIAGLAGRRVPDAIVVLQLVGAMLPVQFCIGVVNDVADLQADAVAKPYKPLVRGSSDAPTRPAPASCSERSGSGLRRPSVSLRSDWTPSLWEPGSPTTWGYAGRHFRGCRGGAAWRFSRWRDTRRSVRSHRDCSSCFRCRASSRSDSTSRTHCRTSRATASPAGAASRSLLDRVAPNGQGRPRLPLRSARTPACGPARPGRTPVLRRPRGARRRGVRSGHHPISAAVSGSCRVHGSLCSDLVGRTPANLTPLRRLGTIGRRAQVAQW